VYAKCAFVSLALALVACAYGVQDAGYSPSGAGEPHPNNQAEDASPIPFEDAGAAADRASTHDSATLPDSSTIPDTAPPEAAAQDSAFCRLTMPTGIAACDACLGQSCCALDNTCGTDPSCMGFLQCGNQCIALDGGAQQTCLNACAQQYPTGANELSALDSCLINMCNAPCGGP
jgi:hypothetical protein